MTFRTKEEEKRRNRIESGGMDGENFNQNRIAGNGQRWVAKVPRVPKVPCKFLINQTPGEIPAFFFVECGTIWRQNKEYLRNFTNKFV